MSIVTTAIGFAFPPAGIAMSVLGKAKSAIGGAVDWVFANVSHLLLAGLAASLAWGSWEHYGKIDAQAATKAGQIARAADGATWARVNGINLASVQLLTGALNNQTASIDQWAATEVKRQNAAKAAQQAAQAQVIAAKGLAAQLMAERAQRAATGVKCAEPGGVPMKGKW